MICAAGGGYNLDVLARATSWGDEPDAAPSYFQERAERQRRELLERYGKGVPFAPLPHEHIEQAQAAELLPAPVREAMERARADAFAAAMGASHEASAGIDGSAVAAGASVLRALAGGQRDSFLQAVAAQLVGTPADPAVEQAVNVALDRVQPVFLCDSAAAEKTDDRA